MWTNWTVRPTHHLLMVRSTNRNFGAGDEQRDQFKGDVGPVTYLPPTTYAQVSLYNGDGEGLFSVYKGHCECQPVYLVSGKE